MTINDLQWICVQLPTVGLYSAIWLVGHVICSRVICSS